MERQIVTGSSDREIWFEADAHAMRGYRIVHWKGGVLLGLYAASCIAFVVLVSMMHWRSSWILAGIAATTAASWVMFDRHADFS